MNTDKAQKDIDKILKDNKLKIGYKLDFPQYKILPDEVLLAIKILERHQMRIIMMLESKQ